jgi:multidrug resistance efflux pump
MKQRIELIAALMVSFGLCISCAPTHFAAPSAQPTRAAIATAQTHTTRAQTHIKTATDQAKTATTKTAQLEKNLAKEPENLKLAQDVHGDLDLLTQSLLNATSELGQTQAALADSQGKLTALDLKVKKLSDDANAALAAFDRQKVKYHRLKLGACSIGAGLVGMVAFHFGRFLVFLGPYAWAVLLGAPAVTFAALWFIL